MQKFVKQKCVSVELFAINFNNSGLDETLQEEVMKMMKRIWNEGGS